MQSTTLLHRTLCLETALSVIISSFSQEKKGVAAFANKVMDLIDTMATSSIDRSYIDIQMESTINGKHFSYSAYDQSAYQLRSAGSFIVGATYYYSVNYAENRNAEFILYVGDVGKAQQWQASIGMGDANCFVSQPPEDSPL